MAAPSRRFPRIPARCSERLDHEVHRGQHESPPGDRPQVLRRDRGPAPDGRIPPVEHRRGRCRERDGEVRPDERGEVDADHGDHHGEPLLLDPVRDRGRDEESERDRARGDAAEDHQGGERAVAADHAEAQLREMPARRDPTHGADRSSGAGPVRPCRPTPAAGGCPRSASGTSVRSRSARSTPMWAIQTSPISAAMSAPATRPTAASGTASAYVCATSYDDRADARSRQVAEHREVGGEGEHEEQPPGVPGPEVDDDGGDGDCSSFGVEEQARQPVGHSASVRPGCVTRPSPGRRACRRRRERRGRRTGRGAARRRGGRRRARRPTRAARRRSGCPRTPPYDAATTSPPSARQLSITRATAPGDRSGPSPMITIAASTSSPSAASPQRSDAPGPRSHSRAADEAAPARDTVSRRSYAPSTTTISSTGLAARRSRTRGQEEALLRERRSASPRRPRGRPPRSGSRGRRGDRLDDDRLERLLGRRVAHASRSARRRRGPS